MVLQKVFSMAVHMSRLILPVLVAALLSLTACKTSEQKAEDYYQSGLALLAKGDEDRAMIEFRNVFKYNGFHKDARKIYADTLVKEGKLQEAYSQYLRLIEQYPDMVGVRVRLAEFAMEAGDWAEAERHGSAAIALAPDDPAVQAVKLDLDFRAAALAKDRAAQDRLVATARTMLATQPDSKMTRRIVIGTLMTGPDPRQALPVIEAGLQRDAGSLEWNMLKFRLLAQTRDIAGAGAQLKKMVTLFPDNTEVASTLIGWYMGQKDMDGAESFLRQLAGADDGPTDAHLALVQFLQIARTPEAARAELDRLITANQGSPKADLYAGMRASLEFDASGTDAGRKADAIAALQTVVKAAAPSDQTRALKAALASMLDQTQNRVGARALVEEILAEDPAQVPALKLRARWFIQDDKPGNAIVDLRAALDQSPRDTAVLMLMAEAYERDGSLDLASDQMAKAVEVSGAAPAESLRYARFLSRLGRVQAVETVLTDAMQASPHDQGLLRALARYYIDQKQWVPASATLESFKALNLPGLQTEIQTMQAEVLAGQNRIEESLALLQSIPPSTVASTAASAATSAATGTAAVGTSQAAVLSILQTQIRAGKTAEARAYLDTVLAKAPDDPTMRLMAANLDQLLGKLPEAEAAYRKLIAADPVASPPVQQLYQLLRTAGRDADAAAVLQAGLAAQPTSRALRWLRAAEMERAGQIDAAIAVYEALYAEASDDTVVANNLASLISAHHDDAASLARAETIARRLRGLDVPAFQDTYGWIALRQGNLDDALAHLEPAARGLPKDALTQYHLGMVYDKLGRSADAIRQFDLALALAGPDVPAPMADVAARLTALKAAAPQPATSP